MTTGSVGPAAADREVPPASPLAHGSPDHLRGMQPASTGMRATALVVDAVVVSLINAMCLMPTVIAVQLTSTVTIAVATVFAFLGTAAVIWFEVIDLWRRGQTLGMRVVGISWLRWSLPGRPGLNAIAKMLVLSIVSSLTLGIGAVIIYLISEDRRGRSWFDRISDIIVVTAKDTGSGEEPSGIGTHRPSAARGGEAFDPQWLALRDEDADDGADGGNGHDRFRRPEDPEDLIEADEHLQPTLTVEVRRAQSEAHSTDASEAASGTEGFITEVPWRSGEPEAAAAPGRRPADLEPSFVRQDGDPVAAQPGSAPLSPLSTPLGSDPSAPVMVPLSARQEQTDRPVAPSGAPVGSQDHWAPQDSCAGEDPMDRTVARPAPRSAPSLLLDTGQRVDLAAAGTVLLGRDPQAAPPWEGARTVAVDDPGFSISKTHVAVVLDGTGVLVEDLGSTNGTTVETPDGALMTAGEGQRVRASVGDIVHVGQRRFTVGH